MATQTIVRLVDDIDGNEAEETIEFGIDGVNYEIDVTGLHAKELREGLAKFIEHARRAKARGRRRGAGQQAANTDRARNQAIREWARERGVKISDRGRIPQPVLDAYEGKPTTVFPNITEANEDKARDMGIGVDSPNKEASPVVVDDAAILTWWNEVKKFKQQDKVNGLMRSKYRKEVTEAVAAKA